MAYNTNKRFSFPQKASINSCFSFHSNNIILLDFSIKLLAAFPTLRDIKIYVA